MRTWLHSFALAGLSSLIVVSALVLSTFVSEEMGMGFDLGSVTSKTSDAQQAGALSALRGGEQASGPSDTAASLETTADSGADPDESGASAVESAAVSQEPVTPVTETARFLSTDERDALVSLHNKERVAVGSGKLLWAPYLAESAALWANALASRGCVLEHSGGQYGETIFYGRKYGSDLSPWTPNDVMTHFIDEKRFYNEASHTCAAGKECGHYTQIVWSDTTRVGCAKSLCEANGEREEVGVCHYDPRGNIEGQSPY